MKQLKIIIVMLVIIQVYSCSNHTEVSNKVGKLPVTSRVDTTHYIRDTLLPLPKPSEYQSVYPKGHFKTYPQIVRSLFAEGSNQSEVSNIMGKAELVEPGKGEEEVWYYGNSEIHFLRGLVNKVLDNGELKGYITDFRHMLISDDPNEKKFALMILERQVKLEHPRGL